MNLGWSRRRSSGPAAAEPQPAEPRLELRKPLMVLNVKDRAGNGGGSRTFFGYATKISRGGFTVPATWPKEIGSEHFLEVALPAPVGRRVRAHCEVVWRRPYSAADPRPPGMGLRFLDLPERDSEEIARWIERETARKVAATDLLTGRDRLG